VETGGVFDPLNFSKDAAKLDKYRAVELKHGRIAMLGVLGIWIQAAGRYTHTHIYICIKRELSIDMYIMYSMCVYVQRKILKEIFLCF
jgi:hypothetical protein